MLPKWRARGIVAALAFLGALLAWMLARPGERIGDVPYVATRPAVIDRMLELAGVGPQDLVVDLGSGDGRIVLRAAGRYGARARGIEIDPQLVRASREAAVAAGAADRVEFVEGDLFAADLRDATAITMFLLPTVNLRLRPRLLAELAPGTPVVSHMWDMGEWSPDRHEVVALEPPADVYRWIVPDGFAGVWDVHVAASMGRAGDGPASSEERVAARAGVGSPDGGIELRLMQRFQELEGELLDAGERIPVAGRILGRRARVTTARPHSRLGDIAVEGTRDGAGWGGVVHWGPPDGRVSSDFRATLLESTVEGVWRFAFSGRSSAPRWTMRWQHSGGAWTATRWASDTEVSDPSVVEQLPMPDPTTAPAADDMRGQRVDEVYVWGGGVAFFLDAGDGSARPTLHYGLVDGDRMIGMAHEVGALVPWAAERQRNRR